MGIPRPADDRQRHEALFLERYDLLVGWATKLVERDRTAAEDLVQEAFVQFVLARPDLDVIENLEGYLFRMLRNLHISSVRRAARSPAGPSSLIEYETAEIGLAAGDLRRQVEIQDDLRRLSRFLSARTLSSKAASVLIFRFFHGYYPAEIARIAGCSRQEIAVLLHTARAEARLVLAHPRRLRLLSLRAVALPVIKFNRTDADFIADLRLAVLQLRHGGRCASRDDLQRSYATDAPASIDTARLAHLATCAACLDRTNRVLGLPPLAERHPTDMLGRDRRGGGGSAGDGGASGPGGASINNSAASRGASVDRRKAGAGHMRRSFGGASGDGPDDPRWRQVQGRLRAIHSHIPTELRIVINGVVRGTQGIVGTRTELTLGLQEEVEFVEVLSEQGVRLLFVTVDPPPNGSFEHHAQLALSDDRQLDLTIDLGGVWPHVLVEYRCPEWLIAPFVTSEAEAVARAHASENANMAVGPRARPAAQVPELLDWMVRHVPLRTRWLKACLRPVLVGVRVTLIAVLVMSLLSWPGRHVSASALLQDAAFAEARAATARGPVTYRRLSLQESALSPSRIVTRQRLEVWTDAARGIAATRVYDEQKGLIAGEWRHADGQRTLYRPHAAPMRLSELSSPGASSSPLDVEALRRHEPSIALFTSLIGSSDAASVREQGPDYIIEYHSSSASSPSAGEPLNAATDYGLRSATLTLRQSDLHPIAQTFVVDVAGETREITITEALFEAPVPTMIQERVFEPDAELLAPAPMPIVNRLPTSPIRTSIARPEAATVPGLSSLDRDNLELKLWYGLQRSGVWLGEHAHVDYAANGSLVVQVPSHSQDQSESVRRALGELAGSPHLLLTFVPEEATPDHRIAANEGSLMQQMLQAHFSRVLGAPAPPPSRADDDAATVTQEAVERAVTQMIGAILERTRQRSARVRAMEALVTRWTPDTLRTLPLDTRALWLAMLRTHARALAQDTQALRSWLQPIMTSRSDLPAPTEPDALASVSVVDLPALTRRVTTLVKSQDALLEAALSSPVSASDVSSMQPDLLEVERLLAQFSLPQSLDP